MGKCTAWCKGVPCKYTDKSITFDCLKYDHLQDDKGKWPDAYMPGSGGKARSSTS